MLLILTELFRTVKMKLAHNIISKRYPQDRFWNSNIYNPLVSSWKAFQNVKDPGFKNKMMTLIWKTHAVIKDIYVCVHAMLDFFYWIAIPAYQRIEPICYTEC